MLRNGYVRAVAVVLLATVISLPLRQRIADSELVMVFFLAIVIVAAGTGRGPATLAALLSVAFFDFFFVAPYLTFRVADVRHLLTFAMMLLVGVVIGTLTSRLREHAGDSDRREHRKAALLGLAKELTVARERAEVAASSERHVRQLLLEGTVVIFAVEENGELVPLVGGGTLAAFDSRERSVARTALEAGEITGCGTDTGADALGIYLPLRTSTRTYGVLGVLLDDAQRLADPDPRRLLVAMADLTAVALERVWIARDAERAALKGRTEEVRNTLLSSVSHDLRTPLASIKGAATALLTEGGLGAGARRDLLVMVQEEADRLERLVANLLDMTRLESGGLVVRKQWVPLDEVVGAALRRFDGRLAGRVLVDLPAEVLVPLDDVLIGNVLVNLLENVLRHTPPGTPIEIRATVSPSEAVMEVADRGPGIPGGAEEKVFEKFWQAGTPSRAGGVGLGLPICRGIVEAHGGRLTAHANVAGGAVLRIVLPIGGSAPEVPAENRDGA